MKKACIIGHFGFGHELLNGQTIKTKIVAKELARNLGEENILLLDLAGGAKKIPELLFKVPAALKECENFIMLPVENGLRFLVPLLGFWNRIFKRKLHYVVIGGWLAKFLDRKENIRKGLKKFDGIYAETTTMQKALHARGLTNVTVMPNCKELTPLAPEELAYTREEPYRLCTFSRVMKEKGIEDAVTAVEGANRHFGRTVYALDIYGQIDQGQTSWFDDLQKTFPAFVKYGGSVAFDKSVETLKDYFALLFPTRFFTEGIPGTIIDAYAAGIPVVSARWESFDDLVEHGKTGLGYPFGDGEALKEVLINIAENKEDFDALKGYCLEKSKAYTPAEAIKVLLKELG